MDLLVRPARPDDPCVPLLFESAKPYYTAYAGSEQACAGAAGGGLHRARPRRQLRLLHGRAAPTASSWASSPASRCTQGDRLSRRFVRLDAAQAPAVALAGDVPAPARRRAASRPRPPADAYYVDALAVADGWRRRGIARRLLDEARARGRAQPGSPGSRSTPACRTTGARALYESYGFGEREIRRAAERADGPRARRAGVRRLPQGGVEHALERLGDLRDLDLA